MKPTLLAILPILLSGVLSAESIPAGQITIKIIVGQDRPNRAETPEGINVIGTVNRPGFVKITAPISVEDAIAAVGGISRLADLSKINIIDYISGNTYHIQFQGNLSRSDKDAVLSRTFVKPGDVLYIPERYD